MRTVSSTPRLVISLAMIALGVAACTARPEAPPGPRSTAVAAESIALAVQPAALTCSPPLRVCSGCTGEPICAIRCPECPPPSVAPAALTCTSGQRVCVGCDGELHCFTRCPECAPPAAPTDPGLTLVADAQACGNARALAN